jgi:Rieske Fe-S protein
MTAPDKTDTARQPNTNDVSRRTVLAVGAAGVGAVALTGCSKAKSTDSPRVAAAGPGVLAKLADLPVGGAISAQDASGQPILIIHPTNSSVAAFSAICPHQGCTVAKTFHCPCHGSTFDPTTGAHISGPAPTGLKTVAVKISGADIVAG